MWDRTVEPQTAGAAVLPAWWLVPGGPAGSSGWRRDGEDEDGPVVEPGVETGSPLGVGDPRRLGEYAVLARLGEGGQGVVYLARSPSGERVAIKVLHAGALRDPQARARFAREVAAARRVAPFCTAAVRGASLDGDQPFVVSEYVPGPSLAWQVAHRGPLAGPALDRLSIAMVTALAAVHRARIVHRDFKPGNVLLGPDGPRVIDFGIARDLTATGTGSNLLAGTPAYMAPEQLSGSPPGPPADMFAWAATMVYAATGRTLFAAPDMAAVIYQILHAEPDLTGLPSHLAAVAGRCLARDPAVRPDAPAVLLSLLGRPTIGADLDGALSEAARMVAVPPAVSTVPPAPFAAPGPAPVTSRQGHRRAGRIAAAAAGVLGGMLGVWAVLDIGPGGEATAGGPAGLVTAAHAPVSGSASSGGPRATGIGDAAEGSRTIDGTTVDGAGAGGTGAGVAGTLAGTTGPAGTSGGGAGPGTVPAAGPVVPAVFAGTWQGRARQRGATSNWWNATIALPARSATATMALTGPIDCRATLTVVQPAPTDRELHLYQHTTADPGRECAPAARITLVRVDPDTVDLFWQDVAASSNVSTATLGRS